MSADFYSLEIDSSNDLPLYTHNGLARSNCFAYTVGALLLKQVGNPTSTIGTVSAPRFAFFYVLSAHYIALIRAI
jgi:hypothetical protein